MVLLMAFQEEIRAVIKKGEAQAEALLRRTLWKKEDTDDLSIPVLIEEFFLLFLQPSAEPLWRWRRRRKTACRLLAAVPAVLAAKQLQEGRQTRRIERVRNKIDLQTCMNPSSSASHAIVMPVISLNHDVEPFS